MKLKKSSNYDNCTKKASDCMNGKEMKKLDKCDSVMCIDFWFWDSPYVLSECIQWIHCAFAGNRLKIKIHPSWIYEII